MLVLAVLVGVKAMAVMVVVGGVIAVVVGISVILALVVK